jgi:hypothetical protein
VALWQQPAAEQGRAGAHSGEGVSEEDCWPVLGRIESTPWQWQWQSKMDGSGNDRHGQRERETETERQTDRQRHTQQSQGWGKGSKPPTNWVVTTPRRKSSLPSPSPQAKNLAPSWVPCFISFWIPRSPAHPPPNHRALLLQLLESNLPTSSYALRTSGQKGALLQTSVPAPCPV